MSSKLLMGMLMACTVGCAANVAPVAKAPEAGAPGPLAVASDAPSPPGVLAPAAVDGRAPDAPQGPWIGASGASDFVLAGTNDTFLGVWVDVPRTANGHAPAAVALVIDTSGSMAGAKIENARAAARSFVEKLTDGDIVSIETFDSTAVERVAPTVLDRTSRAAIFRAIDALQPAGSTDLFDGLRLGEDRVLHAPATHPVRRVVLISDGIANVGPSSPEILGQLAARGARSGVQITSVGVGLDYDEHTLDALAVQSSGRLYHLTEPREMSAMLEHEIALLGATAATGAFVDVVPAPGVILSGVDNVAVQPLGGGGLRVALGTMFGGQHRELLVRVRVNAAQASATDGARPLASVRLHFQDPSDGNLDRVQEVVARYRVTQDQSVVALHESGKTRAIAATQEAAKVTDDAAKQLNDGRFDAAEKDLALAEQKLRDNAARAALPDQQRMMAQATRLASIRHAAKSAAASPAAAAPAARRASALEANHAVMDAYGF